MADFLVIDVGGDDLAVEINVEGATYRPDRSGTSKSRSASGKTQIVVTYDDKGVWTFTTKPLTTDEFVELVAAAQYPETITVGGEALRNTSANTVPQTVECTVLVEDVDYMATGDDFLHVAKLTIEQD
jgi:hypothetical protein